MTIVMYTDGVSHAGDRYGRSLDVCELIRSMLEDMPAAPQEIADTLLGQAIRLDEGRPSDDMSVVVMRTVSNLGDQARRMTVRIPVGVD
jgi:serine phosphatase RsbU (regulator of sigma subunit)